MGAGSALGAAGELGFVSVVEDGVAGVDGLRGAERAAVSPDGKHVYVTGFSDNALAAFSRNPSTGRLSFVDLWRDGVDGVDGLAAPQGVVVSPDGKQVYAASFADDALVTFARNPTSGRLTFVEQVKDGVGGVDGLNGANSVAVAPDGKHVYATGGSDDAVAAFARNPANGRLSFLGARKDGVGGVNGLDGAAGIVVAPNGKQVYVAATDEDALSTFSRNPTTGQLGFVTALRDGFGGVDGLDGPEFLAIPPDGEQVYATGFLDDSVSTFSRNPTTGRLGFLGLVKDGVGGVDGLDAAFGIAASADGKHVYAAGISDNAIVAFARDPSGGGLTPVDLLKDGVDGVDGLGGARGVIVSPDGKHVYATSGSDNAVATFARDLTAPPVTILLGATIRPRKGIARFRFTAADDLDPSDALTFRCALDDQKPAACSSPKTLRNLEPGRHRFEVRAQDSFGNLDATAEAKSFRIKR